VVGSDFALRILDPPMEGFEPVKRRGRVLKITSVEGPMILRVEKIRSFFSGVLAIRSFWSDGRPVFGG